MLMCDGLELLAKLELGGINESDFWWIVVPIALVGKIASLLATIFSCNVEIALMTKKQQWKYIILNSLFYIVVMWLINVGYGYLFYFVDDSNIESLEILLSFTALVIMCALILLFVRWCDKKLNNLHLYRALCLVIKRAVLYIKQVCTQSVNKVKNAIQVNKKDGKILTYINEIWKGSAREKAISTKNRQDILKVIAVVFVWVGGILTNCYLSVLESKEYKVLLVSTLITIAAFMISSLFMPIAINLKLARICYFDTVWNKLIFVYFRYDDKHCVSGDAPQIYNCKEFYLIPYKKIVSGKVFPVSRIETACFEQKRIRLQVENKEFILQDVLAKVKNELITKNIGQGELDRTDIYIKPEEEKAYYVVAGEKCGDVRL